MKENIKDLFKHTPKMGQQVMLKHILKRYIYALFHRQYGKTHFARVIGMQFLLFHKHHPEIGVVALTLKQAKKLYKSKYENLLKPFNPTFDKDEDCLIIRRPLDNKWAKIHFLGTDYLRKADAERGATLSYIIADEYGSYKKGYLQSVIAPMGDIYKAPMFITGTPMGPNHFKEEHEAATEAYKKGDPDFYAIKWDINRTLKEKEMTIKEYNTIKKRYLLSPALIRFWRAEYLLDWYAYYGSRIFSNETNRARDEGRFGYYEYNPRLPVDTFWDIGLNGTAVWFRQYHGNKRYYIDYHEMQSDANLRNFCMSDEIQRAIRKYNFGTHIWPFDMKWGEWTAKESRIDVAKKLIPGKHSIGLQINKPDEAIDKVRRNFHTTYFNEDTTKHGFKALEMYKFADITKRKTQRNIAEKVDKDDYSHGSDAFVLSEVMGGINNFEFQTDIYQRNSKNNSFTTRNRFDMHKGNIWWRA